MTAKHLIIQQWKNQCFQDATDVFIDGNKTVLHPPNWKNAVINYGGDELNANDYERMDLQWTATDIETLYKVQSHKN